MKRTLSATLTLILLSLTLFVASPAHACLYSSTPWYVVTVNVDSTKLPPQLQVAPATDTTSALVTVELSNPSDMQVDIVRVDQYYQGSLNELKPEDYFLRYSLRKGDSLTMYIDVLNDASAWGVNGNDNRWNKYEDNRPADVSIPESEVITLTFITDDKVYQAPFTLSYSLNADYDPKSVEKGAEGCRLLTDNTIPVLIILSGVIFISLILGVIVIIIVKVRNKVYRSSR